MPVDEECRLPWNRSVLRYGYWKKDSKIDQEKLDGYLKCRIFFWQHSIYVRLIRVRDGLGIGY